ncbi:hypothetical protein N9K52_02295 [Litoricolaceae bacterium]|nr:hypothetical protein [Litorivicinaceae bacterium]
MSIIFSYQDVSISSGVVTRKLSVSTNPDVLSTYFAAFQLWISFDPSVVTIESQSVNVSDPQALFAINPPSPEASSSAGLIKMAGLSLIGVAPGEAFFEITYSHAAGFDPVFEVSNILIDEDLVSADALATRQSAPNPEIVVPAPAPEESRLTVLQVLDSDGGYTLYLFDDQTTGFSATQVSADESLDQSDVKLLQQSFGVPIDVSAVIASGLTSVDLSVVNSTARVNIGLADGSRSVLDFGLATGVLTASESIPDPSQGGAPPVGETEEVLPDDGINTGSGVSDTTGLEVSPEEVTSLVPAAADAIAVYRQRLGDAVAIEAVNRDGSIVGKFIGDSDARTVRQIKNGTSELVVDLPAASGIDSLGLSGDVTINEATAYLNDLIDSAVPASSVSTAPWNNSLKRAVNKASSDQLGKSFKLDVITPYKQLSGSDEMAIGFSGDGNAVGALNLSQVDDLVSVSGYDSVVAVGPGRMLVSGSSGTSVYGDVWEQQITGGRGDDFISGGGGSDVLTGGAGSDTFELGFEGTTTITDLSAEDQLAFDLYGVSNATQLFARIAGIGQGSAGLRIEFDTFAVEFVGYSDPGQISNGLIF